MTGEAIIVATRQGPNDLAFFGHRDLKQRNRFISFARALPVLLVHAVNYNSGKASWNELPLKQYISLPRCPFLSVWTRLSSMWNSDVFFPLKATSDIEMMQNATEVAVWDCMTLRSAVCFCRWVSLQAIFGKKDYFLTVLHTCPQFFMLPSISSTSNH